MWQVSGRSDITDFEEVVRLDKEYIENWNIGLDICYFAYLIAITFIYHNKAADVHLIISNLKIVFMLCAIEYLLKRTPDSTINIMFFILITFVLIDFASIVLFPNGLYQTEQIWNEWSSSQEAFWIYGNKNNRIYWYVLLSIITWLRYIFNNKSKVMVLITSGISIVAMMLVKSSTAEYVKDMGTPDRFHQVEEDFKAGRVSAKNLSNKQKAVFLDRDGTVNKYVGFLRNINDFELIDGVAEAIKKINASGHLAIVVTNQPVIARGEVTFQELEEIHNKMETELGLQGAYLDAIYYCPHHPHKGYEGEVPELKLECDCRKPKPGMLLKAADDYNIDLSQSYMIGDGENDIKAGLAAGCKAVLINGEGTDAKNEDFGQIDTMDSVLEFVDKYLC